MRRLGWLIAWLCALTALVAPAAPPAKPRVAVLYFEPTVRSDELKVFAKGLASLLIADLSSHDGLTLVERERLEEVIAELKLGEGRFADPGSFAKVGQLLGANYLVVGTLIQGPKQVVLAPRIIEVGTASIVTSFKTFISGDDVFAGEEEAAKKIAAALEKAGVPASTHPAPPKTGKLSLPAATKYAQALDAKDKKDKPTAKKLMAEVVKEQPDFKLAQLDLLSLND